MLPEPLIGPNFALINPYVANAPFLNPERKGVLGTNGLIHFKEERPDLFSPFAEINMAYPSCLTFLCLVVTKSSHILKQTCS